MQLHVMNKDQLLLLEHWARITHKAIRSKAFSMWCKFSAHACVASERRLYYGCFILKEDHGYMLRWDGWEHPHMQSICSEPGA
jgi:hypothetical protein